MTINYNGLNGCDRGRTWLLRRRLGCARGLALQITQSGFGVEDALGEQAKALLKRGLMAAKAAAEYPKSNPRTEQKDNHEQREKSYL